MRIAALKVNDPWFGRLVADHRADTESLAGVPIEATVEMELVELLHGGPEQNYRPYLHLRGELTEATPAVELPYGVDTLALRRGSGIPIDAFYDFNQRQLGELVGKGYFTEQFLVPSAMSGIPWSLPGVADFLIVAPEYADQPPVVFMGVHDDDGLELDESNSGYDLAVYFPDFTPESEAKPSGRHAAPLEKSGEAAFEEIDEVVFEDAIADSREAPSGSGAEHGAAEEDPRTTVPESVFSRLVSEIEAHGGAVSGAVVEAAAAPIAVDPGLETLDSRNLEDEYRRLAVQGYEASAQQVESEDVGTELLDLGDPEPELAPARFGTTKDSDEEHLRAATRRSARIRAQLAAEQDSEAAPEGVVDGHEPGA